jgi:hypothetical protein
LSKGGSSPSNSVSNSNSKNNEGSNDDILPLTVAFMYAGKREIPHIVQQFLTASYGNEKFTYVNDSSHHDRRRSADYWDWESDVSCTTTQTGGNQSVFTTRCNDTGRITSQYCFSGDDTTYISIDGNYTAVALKDMEKYYDSPMIVYKDGNISNAKFLTFVHIDHTIITTFLVITLDTTALTITKNHLLYKLHNDCDADGDFLSENCIEKTFSESLNTDDFLYVFDSYTNTLGVEKIADIRSVTRMGIYSPMTESGDDFFVNNVLVSPFSTFNQPILNSVHYMYAAVVSYFN